VYCHVFITLELMSPAMGIVLRILYTTMLAVIAERPGVQGWALKATSSRGTVSWWWIVCILFTTYAALLRHSQSNSLWGKTSQHHLASVAAAVVP